VSEVIQNNGQKEILLLSLGTGITQPTKEFSCIFDLLCDVTWILDHVEVITELVYRTDMTHYYLATIFPGLVREDNYLRIEVYIARFFFLQFFNILIIEENKTKSEFDN